MQKILVIDDTVSIIHFLKNILENSGYFVYSALSGEEGIMMALKINPDLIILDIMMPQVNGYEIGRRMKNLEELSSIPIIYISSLLSPEDRIKAFEAGGVDYLQKPIDTRELLLRINIHLQIHNLQNGLKSVNQLLEEQIEKLEDENTSRQIVEKKLIKANKNLQELNQALSDKEKQYRLISNNTSDIIWTIDNNLNYTYISPSVKKIRGIDPEQVLNKNVRKFVNEESWKTIQDAILLYQNNKSFESGETTVTLHIYIKNSAEEYIWSELNFRRLIDENGQKIGYVGITRDITERKKMELELKESEKRFQLLANLSSEGILIHIKNKIVEINEAFIQIFGYTREELIGNKITDFRFSTDSSKEKIRLYQQLDDAYLETELIRRTGDIIFVELTAKKTIYQGEEAKVILVRDVTQQKAIESKILNTIIDTEEKERTRFAQELHDGLGPIISISKMYLQSLLKEDSTADKTMILNKTEKLLEEAHRTVKEISNNLSPYILQNFGLNEALQSFIEKVKLTTQIDINYKSNLDHRLNQTCEIVLYRTLTECINNTIKFANAKNIFINIKQENNDLNVKYIDNGIGFDVKEIMEIKHGFGLFNMQNRLKSIKADFQIKSKKNKGFKFFIKLNI